MLRCTHLDPRPGPWLMPTWRPQAFTGGRVDGTLVSAFTAVSQGDVRVAEQAVVARASQLLQDMPTPLLLDLYALHTNAQARCGPHCILVERRQRQPCWSVVLQGR